MSKQMSPRKVPVITGAAIFAVAVLIADRSAPGGDTPVGTAFTYQGELLEGGSPVDDLCELEFSLWDDPLDTVPEAQVGSTIPQTVDVANGRFTTSLDFGTEIFTGNARWLEIAVCCPSPCGDFATLSPRQELTPAPHAVRAISGVGGPDAINVDAGGNVGIGTNTPQAKLHVQGGPLKVGNSISIDNLTDTITATSGTISFDDDNLVTSGVIESTSGGFRLPDGTILDDAGDLGGGLWSLNGSDIYYDAGNVGIGTPSPNQLLHIEDNDFSGWVGAKAKNKNAGSSALAVFSAHNDDTLGYGVFGVGGTGYTLVPQLQDSAFVLAGPHTEGIVLQAENPAGTIDFYVANNHVFTADSASVGIGTSSPDPTTKLHVVGKTRVDGLIESTTGGFKFPDGTIQDTASTGGLWSQNGADIFYDTGKVGIGTQELAGDAMLTIHAPIPSLDTRAQLVIRGSEQTGAADTGGRILFAGHDGTIGRSWATIQGVKSDGTVGNAAGHLTFSTKPASGAPVERMRIDFAGNVGIGTNTPGTPLAIQGNGGTRPVGITQNQVGGSSTMELTSADGADNQATRILVRGGTDAADIEFYTGARGAETNMVFIEGDNGNVGIGTTSPNSRLEVAGTIHSTTNGFKFPDGSVQSSAAIDMGGNIDIPGNIHADGIVAASVFASNSPWIAEAPETVERMRIDDITGNVGIGTDDPLHPLDVVSDTAIVVINGQSSAINSTGVRGWHTADTGSGFGVVGRTSSAAGIGVFGLAPAGGRAGSFQGDVQVIGTTTTEILEITGADLAEKFPVSEEVEPGMVLEIDVQNPGQLRVARGAYNRRVAGVVSGANDLSVGVILGNLPGYEDAPPIAMSGRVYVLADASNGPIQPGDLLTTSDAPGQAMKVTDYGKAQGAILGKAMSALESGKGLVLVLVSLQ